ncbi:MAG: DUF4476 domain-containing protein, partial [Hymenobacter sp.]
MKTLRLLAAFALATWALAAAAAPLVPPAGLTVYSEQGQPFSFVLDGRALTRPLARQVRVSLLLPGRHWADVSIPTPYGPPMRLRTSLWLQPGLDNGYVLVMRRGGPQLQVLAPGSISGPGYGSPAYGGQYPAAGGAPGQYPAPAPYPAPGQYDDQDGYGNGTSGPPATSNPTYPNGNDYPSAPAPGTYPGGNGTGQPAGPGGYPGGAYPAAPGSGYPAAPGRDGYYPDNAPYFQPLSPVDFSGLQQALSQRPSDDERLNIVKQALSQSTVRTDELAVLIRMLSFDKSRIALAEFGYAHLADPQNFYRVYDALQYRASIREVQQALGLPQN